MAACLDTPWKQTYTYDRYGNRTGVTKSGPGSGSVPLDGLASLSYANGQGQTINNRITTSGYVYDPAGNQTRGQTDNGTWLRSRYDAAGRLAEVRNDSDAVLETYSYGASNQRLKTDYGPGGAAAPPTYYAWDGGQVIGDYRGSQFSPTLSWEKFYVYMGGRLLATLDGGGTKYHHPDRLGTRLVSDAATGTITTSQTNLPYGTALETSGTATNRRFTSYDRSATTGMDYAVNRYYNKSQGRFTQVDPIGMSESSLSDPQTLNLYSYCGNDPINYIDPEGLFFGKLFRWIGKALKWIGIAVLVAVTIVSGPFAPPAGSLLGKILGVLVGIGKAVGAAANFLAGGALLAEGATVAAARLGAGILYALGEGVGAVANMTQRRREKGKVLLSGKLLAAFNVARDRLLKLLRNSQSACAKFLTSKGIDPNKVANVLQSQSPPSDGLKSTIDAADAGINELFRGNSVQSMFKDYGWRAARGKGTDVYYSPKGVRAQTILHETIHQQLGRITDPDLANKIGISSADYQKANDSGIIDDKLAKAGCI